MEGLDSLRGKGWWGRAIAWVISTLFTNSLTWAAVVAAVLTLWGYARLLVESPTIHIFAGVFLFLLWSYIGILYLWDRKKPKLIRQFQDLEYGLTFEGLMPSYDSTNPDATLNFGIQLRNFSAGAIRYTVKAFDVRIGTRAMPPLKDDHLTAILPRGAGRTSSSIAFKYEDIKEFIDKRVEGNVNFTIVYGHPKDKKPIRKMEMSMKFTLLLREISSSMAPVTPPITIVYGDSIVSENDESFK